MKWEKIFNSIVSVCRYTLYLSFWIALSIIIILKAFFNFFTTISWWWIFSPIIFSISMIIVLFILYFIMEIFDIIFKVERENNKND